MALATEGVESGVNISGYEIDNLRFADDIAALAENNNDLQYWIRRLAEESAYMGMKMNTDTTETQYIGRHSQPVSVTVDGKQLKQTESFVYLGGNIRPGKGSEKDIKRRVNLSRQVIQSLTNVWRSRYISKQTKTRVYETLVLSVLLYNSETWVLRESDKRVLLAFEIMCLRRIEGISKRNRIRNLDIRKR